MRYLPLAVGLYVLCLTAMGCAVTEPDDRDTARVRAAVADAGTATIADLASDLGISEAAVVAALPESMRVKLPADDLAAALAIACGIEPVRVTVHGGSGAATAWGASTVRVEEITDGRVVFRAGSDKPEVVYDPADILSIWLCEKDELGPAGQAVLFFGSSGERLMTWEVVRDSSAQRSFRAAWERASNLSAQE